MNTKEPIPFDEAMATMDRLTESYTSKMASLADECQSQKVDAFIYGLLTGIAITSLIGIVLNFWRF